MHIPLLFFLGSVLGILAGFLTRADTQRQNFNNVSVGIIGALLGGLLLPRILDRPAYPGGPIDMAAILLAALVAATCLAGLAAWRHRSRT